MYVYLTKIKHGTVKFRTFYICKSIFFVLSNISTATLLLFTVLYYTVL